MSNRIEGAATPLTIIVDRYLDEHEDAEYGAVVKRFLARDPSLGVRHCAIMDALAGAQLNPDEFCDEDRRLIAQAFSARGRGDLADKFSPAAGADWGPALRIGRRR